MLKFAPAVLFACIKMTSASISSLLKGSEYDNLNRMMPGTSKVAVRCKIEIPRDSIYVTDSFDIVVHDNVTPYIATRIVRSAVPFNCRSGKKLPGYVQCTMKYIQKSVNPGVYAQIKHDAKRILTFIDCHLNGNANEYALFTASALHNTSYFRFFEENCDSSYKSRGLLMIREKANYSKLDRVSCYKKNYVETPECLSKPTMMNIANTIRFWKKIMSGSKMNFESMMDALNTVSWRGYKNSGKTWVAADLKIRNSIYCDLLKLYKK